MGENSNLRVTRKITEEPGEGVALRKGSQKDYRQ